MSGSRTEPGERLAWDRLDATLVTLRTATSVAELVECACELAVEGCGADAAAVGRVTGGVWVPWLRSGRPALFESDEIVPAGPAPLAGARPFEEQVLGSGRTALRELSGGQGEPAVRRVAVAAITTGDTVLGLLHVVGADLRVEIVGSYAQALGSMFGLFDVRRRAEEQRYLLARLTLADSGERAIELYEASADLRGARLGAASVRLNSSALRARLTARQSEVLDLMTSGLSNAEMAERLVVALPTVKSHVRAVLRASGAVNRSDAVARFARGESAGHGAAGE
ncbi:response regulator transcription factor [Pseudonocardia sp. Cha107L01]|uniref:response regulator transcription factor n=1 Tax=Pseudonocardia sp. Cha107L01 TaxID=3457576 RepID=UPI00403EC93E